MTKVFRGLPIMACTCREIQRERAHSIAITSNFQATSERIRRDFHKSSRVSSCASESSESLEKSIHKIDLGRGSRAPKIESKLTSEPSEDTPWHPRAFQERLRSVLGRIRRRSIPSVCKDVPGGQKERPEALGSAPRQPESTPSRTRQ